MLTDSVRRRLEALNRQPLARSADGIAKRTAPESQQSVNLQPKPPEAIAVSTGGMKRSKRDQLALRASQHIASPREGWFGLGEVVTTTSGEHLRMRAPLASLWPQSMEMFDAAQRTLMERNFKEQGDQREEAKEHSPRRLARRRLELGAFRETFPHGPLLLDLETCGFSGSALFLIGLLRHVGEQWTVELLLARNYSEERAVLESLWRLATEHQVLVTFNGKSFDWPMVHDRSTRHHLGRDLRERNAQRQIPEQRPAISDQISANRGDQTLTRNDPRPELSHLDLLHHARRRWKKKLPNCKLQTLERFVCGRRREGDLPGSQIPAAYHHYVRTGETRDMEAVLHHNAVDLITLWELALRLAL